MPSHRPHQMRKNIKIFVSLGFIFSKSLLAQAFNDKTIADRMAMMQLEPSETGEISITVGGRTLDGVPVGESKLSDFILNLKKLSIGSSMPDQIISTIGKPNHVSKQSGIEEWKYNFLVTDNSSASEFEKATLERNRLKQKSQLDQDFYRMLDIQAKTIKKLKTQATCYLVIRNDGHLGSVKVQKISGSDNELLFVKGDAQSPASEEGGFVSGLLPSLEAAPSNPKPGQTYLNTTDSHFYGWNGKAWRQLDTQP